MENDQTPTIKDLYPHLNDAELLEAEDNLKKYLELVLRIFERSEAEERTTLTQEDKMIGYSSHNKDS